jgi:DNA-directed RNA polymerase subunit P
MYRCGKCNEPIRNDANELGLQCDKCGSKIFYKERPNVKKVLKSD